MNRLVKKWSEVAQSCPTLCNPTDCSLPCSSVHGIFQARVLEWFVISFSKRSSWPRDRNWVSSISRRSFYCLSHQGSLYILKPWLIVISKEFAYFLLWNETFLRIIVSLYQDIKCFLFYLSKSISLIFFYHSSVKSELISGICRIPLHD